MDKKAIVLDIAMNLNRIGNWAADDCQAKQKRINLFLKQTTQYINSLQLSLFSPPFKKTFMKFQREYKNLKKEWEDGLKESLFWAEKMMTWGNILTHRSRLIKT